MAEAKKTTKTKTVKKSEKPKITGSKESTKVEKGKAKSYVLSINNMQYIVHEEETILARISPDATEKDVEVKVLAEIDGDNSEFGKPELKKKASFKLGKTIKGKKVIKDIFKAKSRYRRKVGFRPVEVEFTLTKIS